MQALTDYSWLGNIRALRHAVEHAVIMATAQQLSARAAIETVTRRSESLMHFVRS
jgi:DNA-binding NtrC family response regulator